jgi:hypothetical protein
MGNFVRFDTVEAPAPAEAAAAAERNNSWQGGGGGKITIQHNGDGTATVTDQRATIQGSSTVFESDSKGVLSTVRSPMGALKQTSDIKGTDLCIVQGVEMTVEMASKLGMVEKYGENDYGDHDDFEEKAAVDKQAKAAANPELQITGDLLAPEVRETVNQIASQYGQSVIHNGLISAAAAMVSGDKSKGRAAVASFSSQIGQEPAKGEAILSGALSSLLTRISATASHILKRDGEPAEQENVVEFLRHCNKEVKSQIIVRGLSGDLNVVKDVVQRYNRYSRK